MVSFFYRNKFPTRSQPTCLGLFLGWLLALNATPARSQSIQSDGTLNTTVNQSNSIFTITNGTRSGQNLFHSFREFSISTNSAAIFDLTNSPNVSSVFSRVTGDRASEINGVIRTIGGNNPNLFLLNPNGILFGPQAKLDIGGSFLGTTAQSIQFDHGVLFNSGTPDGALLNVNLPIGLQMGFNPAPIQIQGTGHNVTNPNAQLPYQQDPNRRQLQVRSGQTFGLIGGNITLDGGLLAGENILLGAVNQRIFGENTWVGLKVGTQVGKGFEFDYSQIGSYGNIQLKNKSLIDISGSTIGKIQLNAQDIILQQGSLLLAQSSGSTGSQIQIVSQGQFLLEGGTADRTVGSGIEVYTIGSGEGAVIDISAQDVLLRDVGRISNRASGQASTGDIQIRAGRSVQVSSTIPNNSVNVAAIIALTNGQGSAGNIQIQTPLLKVFNDGVISAATLGSGNAGNVMVETDRIEVATGGNIGSSSFVSGNAGTLNIKTQSLNLTNGGLISSNSLGRGNGGTIHINASEEILLSGTRSITGTPSQIRSTVRNATLPVQRQFGSPATATGNGGSIIVRSPKITLDQAAQINVRNEGTGEAGDINLMTQQLQLDNQSSLNGATRAAAGGNITITADVIGLRRGSRINVTAGSQGQGGQIQIDTIAVRYDL
jgi:filamentous hemagglutinin family protein